MRLGNREITPVTLIHAGIFAAALIVLILFGMRSYSNVREAWCRDKIVAALTATDSDSFASGISACNTLIAVNPDRVAPRMYLGIIHCKEGVYASAKTAFEDAAACKSATPEEKSLALSAAASAFALDGAKDNKPAHIDDALKLVEKALAAKATPDALAVDAILKSWRDGPASPAVEVAVNNALAAAPAPNAAALEQLYRLQGNALLRAKRPVEASAAFARVKAVNPFNTQIGEAGRNAQLTEIMDAKIDSAARRVKIEKVVTDASTFGKGKNDALIAAALAYHSLIGEPDFYAVEGPFTKAKAILNQLMSTDPKDPRAYRIFCGMNEERIERLIKELSVTVTGLNGEAPVIGKWSDPPKSVAELSKEDVERLSKIRQFSNEQENTWQKFFDQTADKNLRIEAKSRQVMAIRRQIWSTRAVETAWRESLLDKAAKAATDLSLIDDSGYGHWQLALILLDKGQQAPAFTALAEARKRGFTSPDFDKLISQFRANAEIVDYGPAPGERQFGAQQLVRAALQMPDSGTLTSVKLELDGRELAKNIVATQVFSLVDDKSLTGDSHKVKITAQAGAGHPTVFPEFSLNVDKDAPTWSLTPPPTEDNKAQIWQIELKDASGVEWSKVSAGIRAVKVQNAILADMAIVKDGRYTRTIPSIKVKTGDMVRVSPFQLAPPNELPPGTYKIWIDAIDILGNHLKSDKDITIK